MDALLARPGAYIRDPVLWQWQDDKGNWHTYGYNDCRVIEAAHVAGEEEVTLTVNGKSFTLNLASMHEIKEDSGMYIRTSDGSSGTQNRIFGYTQSTKKWG